ncbi:MAG: metallophosphoesterase family protein, partial [Acidobacteriota bacterium]
HGLLRPELFPALAGVTHILHAGDVGDPEILTELARIAPVSAIRGNIDGDTRAWGRWSTLAATEMIELAGCLIYMVHALQDLDLNPKAAGIGVVISGHSHQASVEQRQGVLYLNPGSAGPRRFGLGITCARLRIREAQPEAEILTLVQEGGS